MTTSLGSYMRAAVEKWPDAPAFRFGKETLNYRALNSKARDLAAALAARGVKKGDRVAIAMTKGLEMPVAIHGIWMAGAAFVPFDPLAPISRLADIVKACEIKFVIGTKRDAKLLEALASATQIEVFGAEIAGATCHDIPSAPPDFEPVNVSQDDMAYVMFTSGSTGVPKGMVHTHRSGMAFAEMWAELYGLKKDDILFCTVPLHFDFCLADFLATPMAGACTVLVPEVVQKFPASLGAALEDSRATIWSTVPFALVQLYERGDASARDFSALRWVIFGGEPMPPRQLAAVREIIGAEFSNSYGPAEVNQVTEYTVPRDHPLDAAVPIGHPTKHAKLAVDDDGGLLVSAPSMMQGYWKRPDLNETAFEMRDGQRFYRTNDKVSCDDAGLWHFGGRADRQVKLRGYRIELDEIEHVLASHPSVSEAAAVLNGDGTELTGHVIAAPGSEISEADIAAHAAKHLPRYAVPARVTLQQSFPRTGTGKINRRLLTEITT